jgi:hypothetical protein
MPIRRIENRDQHRGAASVDFQFSLRCVSRSSEARLPATSDTFDVAAYGGTARLPVEDRGLGSASKLNRQTHLHFGSTVSEGFRPTPQPSTRLRDAAQTPPSATLSMIRPPRYTKVCLAAKVDRYSCWPTPMLARLSGNLRNLCKFPSPVTDSARLLWVSQHMGHDGREGASVEP